MLKIGGVILISNFRWFIKDVLAGSREPISRAEICWLYRQGIRAIISFYPMRPYPRNEVRKLNLQYCTILLENYGIPEQKDITRFLDFFGQMKKAGLPLLIHCQAGIGRTGTMGAIALIESGIPYEKALQIVEGVETEAQEHFIYQFFQNRHDSI